MQSIYFTDGKTIPLNTIFCIGRNYADHIAELNHERPEAPLVFSKPNSSLLHNGGIIHLPQGSSDVHYESEIVVVLGSGGKQLSEDEATAAILGYGVGLDLTARDWQQTAKTQGLPWLLAKGFDGAACISSCIPVEHCPQHDDITFAMYLNGECRQQGNSAMMLTSIPQLIAYLSRFFTLNRGDIIFTGTPKGVGKLTHGDQIRLTLSSQLSAQFEVAS